MQINARENKHVQKKEEKKDERYRLQRITGAMGMNRGAPAV